MVGRAFDCAQGMSHPTILVVCHGLFGEMGRGVYFTGGTPRSLQILLARTSTISLCLGTADLLFNDGLYHQECFAPSLTNSQP